MEKSNRHAVLSVLAGLLLGVGLAQAGTITETTTETTYQGTVSQVIPSSSTLVVTSSAAEPRRYVYTAKTTFVDAAGNVVTRESIANQPVVVYYSPVGETYEVSKVVVLEPAPVVERRIETETVRELP